MSQQYEVNFFKPLTEHAKENKRLIIILATIWAVGVFGFQILLMVLNEPTPEKSYDSFQDNWPAVVENSSATIESKQEFSKSLLAVLGKNIVVKDDHKAVLMETLSWNIYTMLPDSIGGIFMDEPTSESILLAKNTIGLTSAGFDKIMSDLLPNSLVKVESKTLSADTKQAIPEIMKLYLVHNQNFFTDFKFLGFPFHYWYTAQFLLIMFVLLCLVYAKKIDKMNEKHDFVEET
jgi:putative solute:sodium symporter small subunit